MIQWMVSLLYLMLPAFVANMMPIFVKRLPVLDIPIDAGKRFRGFRLLGGHKTWRGVVFATIGGMVTLMIQKSLVSSSFFSMISYVNYAQIPIGFGILMGFGAIVGDSVKSFFKRQFNIASGRPWFPFDQIDYVVGALIFVSPFIILRATEVLFLLGSSLVLHPLFNYLGYLLHIKKNKF